jgi:transcriptional regulator with XRE-family HTH domain
MTQQAVAVAAGLSVSAVVQLESGTNKDPRMSTLKGIAAALGVTVDELLTDDVPAPPPEKRKRKN